MDKYTGDNILHLEGVETITRTGDPEQGVTILNVHQSSFRHKHSTFSAATLVLDVFNCLDHKHHCAALFIDLSKVFYTNDHHILIQRLTDIGLNQASCRWFENDLSDRTQYVISNAVKYSFLDITECVPQGSVLGPVVFGIYVNNIDQSVKTCNIPLYADNTVMYAIAPTVDQALSEMQSDLVALQKALVGLKRVFNAAETK
jgi:hypothetical protein